MQSNHVHMQSRAFSGHFLRNEKIIHLEAESSKKVIFPTTLLFKAGLSKFSFDRKTGTKKLFSPICIVTKKKVKIAPTILCLLEFCLKSVQKIQHTRMSVDLKRFAYFRRSAVNS